MTRLSCLQASSDIDTVPGPGGDTLLVSDWSVVNNGALLLAVTVNDWGKSLIHIFNIKSV